MFEVTFAAAVDTKGRLTWTLRDVSTVIGKNIVLLSLLQLGKEIHLCAILGHSKESITRQHIRSTLKGVQERISCGKKQAKNFSLCTFDSNFGTMATNKDALSRLLSHSVWTKKIDYSIFPSIDRLKATPLQDVQKNIKTNMIAKNEHRNIKKWIDLAVGTTSVNFAQQKRKRE
jgi:hypothetical protein